MPCLLRAGRCTMNIRLTGERGVYEDVERIRPAAIEETMVLAEMGGMAGAC